MKVQESLATDDHGFDSDPILNLKSSKRTSSAAGKGGLGEDEGGEGNASDEKENQVDDDFREPALRIEKLHIAWNSYTAPVFDLTLHNPEVGWHQHRCPCPVQRTRHCAALSNGVVFFSFLPPFVIFISCRSVCRRLCRQKAATITIATIVTIATTTTVVQLWVRFEDLLLRHTNWQTLSEHGFPPPYDGGSIFPHPSPPEDVANRRWLELNAGTHARRFTTRHPPPTTLLAPIHQALPLIHVHVFPSDSFITYHSHVPSTIHHTHHVPSPPHHP